MGLDAVELLLRCEELFSIHLTDDEAAAVRTVGDLYRLICSKLGVTPLPSPITSAELPRITEKEKIFLFLQRHHPLPASPELLPWSSQTIWDALVAIFVDQQGLDREDILPHARIATDLGVD
jgi:acyl carrier protein